MARVLLFNFTQEERRKKVRAALFRAGIPGRDIPPEKQGRTLGELLTEEDGAGQAEEAAEPFREELIVMHELTRNQFHGFLDGLKRAGLAVPLKAVTTETNRTWTAKRLFTELSAEREAVAGGNSIHGRKE
jgi:hypothetical protein